MPLLTDITTTSASLPTRTSGLPAGLPAAIDSLAGRPGSARAGGLRRDDPGRAGGGMGPGHARRRLPLTPDWPADGGAWRATRLDRLVPGVPPSAVPRPARRGAGRAGRSRWLTAGALVSSAETVRSTALALSPRCAVAVTIALIQAAQYPAADRPAARSVAVLLLAPLACSATGVEAAVTIRRRGSPSSSRSSTDLPPAASGGRSGARSWTSPGWRTARGASHPGGRGTHRVEPDRTTSPSTPPHGRVAFIAFTTSAAWGARSRVSSGPPSCSPSPGPPARPAATSVSFPHRGADGRIDLVGRTS